jgi:hypothetical protein
MRSPVMHCQRADRYFVAEPLAGATAEPIDGGGGAVAVPSAGGGDGTLPCSESG